MNALAAPPDPKDQAKALGVSVEACEILRSADFIDAHCDLEVPVKVWGYNPTRHHGPQSWPRPFFGHTDYPRLREAGFTGVVFDQVSNVLKGPAGRLKALQDALRVTRERLLRFPEDYALVRTRSEYDAARAAGQTAAWMALQGGNAVEADPSVLDGDLGDWLHRITLVHLSHSGLGGTSTPYGGDKGLTALGREIVARCHDKRILLDLSHAGERTFWDTLAVHTRDLPPIVSHTGVSGVRKHWRNLFDDQIKAIADRGGVIGVLYHGEFLARVPPGFPCARRFIVDHLAYIVDLVGEDYACLGSDYDGMITPPFDMPDVTMHPLLVQDMLDRGWHADRIAKVLGGNYLRVVAELRP